MKVIHLFIIIIILHTETVFSNNVQVSNVRLTGQNTTDDFTMVEFDISWENSWRYANGPANWDAAWVFVKYSIGNKGVWKHAWLNNTGHTTCGNSSITNGFLSPSLPFDALTNPTLGVFLYRSNAGTGTFSCQNVQLRWNYGVNSVPDLAQVNINVYAIEMVYVPQGGFYVGSGGSELGAFYKYPTMANPYFINSEAAITIGTSPDNLYYSITNAVSGDQSGPVPAVFPKGFNAFYAMKYEISQQAYADFLNSLNREQQQNRVETDISGMIELNNNNRFVMSPSEFGMLARNGISCRLALPPQPGPVDFFCDLNNNIIGNEASDGLSVACGLLRYADLAAYLDWAALRLMTEFEFEKCARGPTDTSPHEYAWGNSALILSTGNLLNSGSDNEIPPDLYSNMEGSGYGGPFRCGAFARGTSNRTTSGAGYYGCLNLSGSVRERGITVGNTQGRTYTGIHGDGSVSASGDTNVENWPSSINATGCFIRGGGYNIPLYAATISDRSSAALTDSSRQGSYGGRGVRTAE